MEIDAGDTAWVLTSTALVLFMTPGLALFYGGHGESQEHPLDADAEHLRHGPHGGAGGAVGLHHRLRRDQQLRRESRLRRVQGRRHGRDGDPHHPGHPVRRLPDDLRHHHAGAHHRRHRRPVPLRAYAVFIAVWLLIVYSPVAHWVWGGGSIFDMGALDFAGGAVVHIDAGAAALALVHPARQAQGLAAGGHAPRTTCR